MSTDSFWIIELSREFHMTRIRRYNTIQSSHGFSGAWLYIHISFDQECTQFFQKPRNHLKILVPASVTSSKSHADDPQIFGAAIQNLVSRASWPTEFVHTCPRHRHFGEISCIQFWGEWRQEVVPDFLMHVNRSTPRHITMDSDLVFHEITTTVHKLYFFIPYLCFPHVPVATDH